MISIGIDNGLTGAAVALGQCGTIIEMTTMPTKKRVHLFTKTKKRKIKGKASTVCAIHKENEIDARSLVCWIKKVTDSQPCKITIEECPEHADQQSTMRSMAISYGILIGSISAALPGYELSIVRSGNPMDSWQRQMLGSVKQGQTKPAALAKARQLWPDETWLATPRSSKPNEGLIDAALIAEYGRTKNL